MYVLLSTTLVVQSQNKTRGYEHPAIFLGGVTTTLVGGSAEVEIGETNHNDNISSFEISRVTLLLLQQEF
jgi:hypothetical protein